jgi:hypothetical protein
MISIPQPLWAPLGAILAALIGGLFSYLALVITKENKVSELRQKWIDELREEMAALLTSVRLVYYKNMLLIEKYKGEAVPPEEAGKSITEHYEPGIIALNKIRLRLNPDGSKNTKSKKLVAEMLIMQTHINEGRHSEACDYTPTVRDACQAVLKEEWERVKTGEPTFYWSKRILVGLVASCFITLGIISYQIITTPKPLTQYSADEIIRILKAANQ